MDDSSPKSKDHDVVLVHGRTKDGEGLRAIRARPDRLDFAELRPAKEGKPLQPGGELVQLHQRPESPALWDVKVQYRVGDEPGELASSDSSARSGSGPACVATERYRRNWDAIFGSVRGSRADRKRSRTLN